MEDFISGVKNELKNNNAAAAAAQIKQYLKEPRKIPLNIAITGESGSGKSTFVNAFRGISDGDERAAPTGAKESSKELIPYFHPDYPNVKLWDLPGIGTIKFPAAKYLKLVKFERFDFFIVISDTGFRENDVKFAQEIQRMRKKFYFVRSKIDNDIRAAERKGDFSIERTLEKIKDTNVKGLIDEGIRSPQVFLLSNFEPHLYEFSKLQETLGRELPAHKRDTLLYVMSNTSLEIIEKKKEAFQSEIKLYAGLSGAVAAVPVPGLSVAVDASLMVKASKEHVDGFGLDKRSLENLANTTGVSYTDLHAVIRSPLAKGEITAELVVKVLSQLACTAAFITLEEGLRWIPLIGLVASAGLSYIVTYKALTYFLDTLAEDAQRVFERALEGLKINMGKLFKTHLEEKKKINIAITGESGSGKSTFVNAFRGISDGDERAAPTGAQESSKEPIPYFHPEHPNVKLWDLPGIGTRTFPAADYLERVKFERFDFFIVISDTGFRENDVKLTQEIQKMKKKFYFVRSKIDNDIRAAERKGDFNNEEYLAQLRVNCIQGLRKQGFESPQVFLVSSFESHLYDFSLLQQTLEQDLPELLLAEHQPN